MRSRTRDENKRFQRQHWFSANASVAYKRVVRLSRRSFGYKSSETSPSLCALGSVIDQGVNHELADDMKRNIDSLSSKDLLEY